MRSSLRRQAQPTTPSPNAPSSSGLDHRLRSHRRLDRAKIAPRSCRPLDRAKVAPSRSQCQVYACKIAPRSRHPHLGQIITFDRAALSISLSSSAFFFVVVVWVVVIWWFLCWVVVGFVWIVVDFLWVLVCGWWWIFCGCWCVGGGGFCNIKYVWKLRK